MEAELEVEERGDAHQHFHCVIVKCVNDENYCDSKEEEEVEKKKKFIWKTKCLRYVARSHPRNSGTTKFFRLIFIFLLSFLIR